MDCSRRRFLKSTGLGFLAFGLPPAFLILPRKHSKAAETKSWWWSSNAAAWTA
jgi:hypothetical protein